MTNQPQKKDNPKNNIGNSEKRWRMADAIFTSGLFGMFYDSKEASQEKDRKKFNQMIIGALTGVVISAVIFGLTCYIFLN